MSTVKFNWKKFEWNANEYTKWDNDWYDNAYFSPKGVNVEKDECINLFIVKSPKEFSNDSLEAVTKNYACGEVSGPDFSFGVFRWRVKMPEGTNIWPALWLSGSESWPPEIDAVEGYTKEGVSYVKNILMTSLESNVHYKSSEKKLKWIC